MARESYEGLDVYEDAEFERRYGYVQRVGWVVLLLFLIVGMLGIFGGSGPLVSATSQEQESGLEVEYQRLARKRSPTTVTLTIPEGFSDTTEITLRVDREYLESYSIEDISPSPDEVAGGNEYLEYTFLSTDPGEATTVTFNLRAQRIGIVSGWSRHEGQASINFRQFVYP